MVTTHDRPQLPADRGCCSTMLTPLLACLLLLPCSGFLITEAEPGLLTAAPDQRVNLRCTTDGHYEWCKFYSPSGQFCDFEWKRNLGNVTTLVRSGN